MAKATLGGDATPARKPFDLVGFLEKYGVLVFLVLLIILFTATIHAFCQHETLPIS